MALNYNKIKLATVFIAVVLMSSCQKGGEPVPYGQGADVVSSEANQVGSTSSGAVDDVPEGDSDDVVGGGSGNGSGDGNGVVGGGSGNGSGDGNG